MITQQIVPIEVVSALSYTLSNVPGNETKLHFDRGAKITFTGNIANTGAIYVARVAKDAAFTWSNDKILMVIDAKEMDGEIAIIAAFDYYILAEVLNEKVFVEVLEIST